GDALGLEHVQHQVVLTVSESFDGTGAGRIIVATLREGDVPGREEVAHTVLPRLAVHVSLVVAFGIERSEGLARPGRFFVEKLVEGLLPGRCVHLGGLGQDTVEIEQPGLVGIDVHGSGRVTGPVSAAHGIAPRASGSVPAWRRGGSRPAGWVGVGERWAPVGRGVGRETGSSMATVVASPKWHISSGSPVASR